MKTMTPFARQKSAHRAAQAYAETQAYCQSANIRLSRDAIDGYWLHYDGRMRFVRQLADIRGWVDYLNWSADANCCD